MSRVPFFGLALSLVAFVSVLPACGGDDDEKTEPRGTVAAQGKCTKSNDCAEASAVCVSGLGVCSEALGADAFSKECTAQSVETCPGFQCVVISSKNAQNKAGICSMPCEGDGQCGDGNVCSTLGTPPQSVTGCFHSCKADGDCANGFVCVSDQSNTTRKICLVQPSAG